MLPRATRLGLMILGLLALLLTRCGADTSGKAQNELVDGTGLRLVPESERVSVGETGYVEIHLDNAKDLYGTHLYVQFDAKKLRVQDADPNQAGIQITPGTFPAPDFAVRNLVDNDRGIIEYAVVQLYPREPAQGSGVVATIHFQGVGEGASTVTFVRAKLADPDGQELPVRLVDAELKVN